MSSSGLVPFSFSKRFANEYGVLVRTPLSAEIVPLPSLSPPCHTAEAFRFISPPLGKIHSSVQENTMRSIALGFTLFILVCGCTRTDTTSTAPTAADAKKFLDEVNETGLKLATESSQAGWVSENFITDDTSALNARANQRAIDASVRYAKDAVKFDHVDVDSTLRRELNLLKVALVMATPSDPREGEELTRIAADMDGEYG